MSFCGKCGTQVQDGVKFCPSCGTPMAAPAAEPQQAQQPQQTQQGQQGQQTQQAGFSEKFQNFNNTADTTADFDPKDVEQNKVMGILAYLSWLVIIPIFAAKDSKFARFHANQGLVLAITEIIWWVGTGIISAILTAISWKLAFISTILGLMNILFLVLLFIGIMNAANGKAKELPIIGKFKILK